MIDCLREVTFFFMTRDILGHKSYMFEGWKDGLAVRDTLLPSLKSGVYPWDPHDGWRNP